MSKNCVEEGKEREREKRGNRMEEVKDSKQSKGDSVKHSSPTSQKVSKKEKYNLLLSFDLLFSNNSI